VTGTGDSPNPLARGYDLRREGTPRGRRLRYAALAALSGVTLASCSTTSDPIAQLGLAPQTNLAALAPSNDAAAAGDFETPQPAPVYAGAEEDDPVLPTEVAAAPTPLNRPEATASQPDADRGATELTQSQIDTVVETRIGPTGPVLENRPVVTASATNQAQAPQLQTAQPQAPQPQVAPQATQPKAKRRGFFASLFGAADESESAPAQAAATQTAQVDAPAAPASTSQDAAARASIPPEAAETQAAARPEPAEIAAGAATATAYAENRPTAAQTALVAPKKRSFFASMFSQAQAAPAQPAAPAATRPTLQLASAAPNDSAEARAFVSSDPLPGVSDNLFEINRKSGTGDDSDIDLHEDEGGIQVASAAGLGRLAPNGLLTQTDHVDVSCIKPSLLRVLKTVEGHYGRRVVVTSGFRTPPVNRRARGARNSLHMYCAAADIQVPGVTKWELASFLRSMPGRGGVGTYCHTESVHIDVGPERDWNWRCRKRKK